jgi:hypothetical protein
MITYGPKERARVGAARSSCSHMCRYGHGAIQRGRSATV